MKIRFLSFAAVGARSPRLRRLGVVPGAQESALALAALPALGVLALAGATPGDLEIDYRVASDAVSAADLASGCDVLAISACSAHAGDAYRLADRCRELGVWVVLGGLHATARPTEAQVHADCVVVGEGEPAWPRLIDDLRWGRPGRLYDTRGYTFDLSLAPVPRYDLVDPARRACLPLQLHRRCPPSWNGPACGGPRRAPYRSKPIANVVAELRAIRSVARSASVRFVDDDALPDAARAAALLRAVAREGVHWVGSVRAAVAEDADLLARMRDSGCEAVAVNLDVAVHARADMSRAAIASRSRQAALRAAIDRFRAHGIAVTGRFVLGLDGAGPESFGEVADFVAGSGLRDVQLHVPTPFPGTPLHARMVGAGRLLRPRAWELCTSFDVNFVPGRMSVAELEDGLAELVATLRAAHGPEATRLRRARRGPAMPRPAFGGTSLEAS